MSRLTQGIALAIFLIVTAQLPSLASPQNSTTPVDGGQGTSTGLDHLSENPFPPTDLPEVTSVPPMEAVIYNISFFQAVVLPVWLKEYGFNSSDPASTCLFRNMTESYVDFTNGGEETWCQHKYDQVFCWDATPPGTTVSRPCIRFNGVDYVGNVTRSCTLNGTWGDNGRSTFDCDAVEMPVDPQMNHRMIQHKILLNIGYSLSLTALIGAFFIFLYFKKLRCVRNNIHWNLVTSFIILYILFYIAYGTQKIANNNAGLTWACRLVICLTNNALLTNFFWMLIEGVYLYLLVVRTMEVRKASFWKYMLFGWGVPVLFTVSYVICKEYIKQEVKPDEVALAKCWLNSTDIDYIIFGPVIICILVNLYILVHVIAILVSKLRALHPLESQQYWKSVRATFILLPLLGGAYLFFIIQPTEDSKFFVFYGYAQVILQSGQGFFVALFYVYMNHEVLELLRRRYRCWKDRHSIQARRTSLTYQTTLLGTRGSIDSGTCNKSNRLYPPAGKVPAFVPGEVVPLQYKIDCTPALPEDIHEWAQGEGTTEVNNGENTMVENLNGRGPTKGDAWHEPQGDVIIDSHGENRNNNDPSDGREAGVDTC